MSKGLMILPIGAGVIGQDDVPLVRIMDSDETPTTITVYGVVDTVQPVTAVTWTVNGVEQSGDVSRSPVLELTNLQPETSYYITLRATNINGESSASARTITTKKITSVTPNDVLDGVSYYNLDVYYEGTIPIKDENDIVVNGRNVTVPTGYYPESETVSVSSEYIIPTGTKNISGNGTEDVTQYAEVNVNVQPPLYSPSNVDPTTSQQTIDVPTGYYGLGPVTVNGVTGGIDPNIQAGNIKKDVTILGVTGTFDPTPTLTPINVIPTKESQVISPTGGVDGFNEVNVYPVTALIDRNITPENIKKDVAILGVTGTFEGGIQPAGTLNIVNNGTYDITNYANVNVNVASGDFNELCFTAEEANSTVYLQNAGGNSPLVYYSTDDKQTWTQWDYSTITLANIGDKVYFYGYNPDGFSKNDNSHYSWFRTTGSLVLSGNIMTLISRYGDREKIPDTGAFSRLFSDNVAITDAENLILPVTDLSNISYDQQERGVYFGMFYGCTNLTKAPTLPATKLGKYAYCQMFYRCTSLTTAPELPATVISNWCYKEMFYNCSSFTTAPELPATTLANNCYEGMFSGCTSLVNAPALPATTLANDCYRSMFKGCTSLTTAPTLPATTLVNNCYYYMFYNCTSLNSITINIQSWSESWALSWVYGVSATGTFIKPYALQIGTGTGQIRLNNENGIPTGWTVYEYPSVTADNNEYITLTVSSGYDIYYTTDGSTPTTNSTLYTEPISVQGLGDTFTLKYISTDNDTFVSPVCEYTYYNMFYIEALENNTVLNLSNWKKQYSWNPVKVQYSTDKNVWTNIETNMSSYTLANTGDRVYFRRATAATSTDTGNVWKQGNLNAVTSGTIKVCGCLEYACYWEITGDRPAEVGCGNMFQNCTGLVYASDLNLFGCNHPRMFSGCTNLVNAPTLLPVESIISEAYIEMFKNCTSLINAPTIMATNLQQRSCSSMFEGCSSLVNVPDLCITTFNSSFGCEKMFKNCTSLVVAPNLPTITTLSPSACLSMFEGCTNLVVPPFELKTTTILEYQCYRSMFKDCTSLKTSPKIKFINWVLMTNQNELTDMFNGCTSLDFIEVDCPSWFGSQSSNNWVANVAQTGTFVKPANVNIPIGSYGIPSGWTVVDRNILHFTAQEANSTIGYTSTLSTPPTIYKSTDGENFTAWDGTAITLSNVGDTLWVYGTNQTLGTGINVCTNFVMTGCIGAYGDVTYLLQDGGTTTLTGNYAFYNLFQNCTSLTTAPTLPATTLTEGCYWGMFSGCTSLTSAPALQSTNLANSCYMYMFKGCTSLTTTPTLPATTLENNCYYQMFQDCTSLTTAPTLPATTLTFKCYEGMFRNCTALITAPTLPATTLNEESYKDMFNGCTSLNNVTCLATDISAPYCTLYWLDGVAATGTFTKSPNMSSWTTGTSGIPANWTVVDTQ